MSCCADNAPVMQSLPALGDCEKSPYQIGTVQGLRCQSQGAGLQLSSDSLSEPPDGGRLGVLAHAAEQPLLGEYI